MAAAKRQAAAAPPALPAMKPRYDLIAPEFLDAMARVLAHGATKPGYSPRGWEAGMSWGHCFGALMRHCWEFWRGHYVDPGSGLPHLAHAACRLMFLYAMWARDIGKDDRYPGPVEAKDAPAPALKRPHRP